MANLPLRVAVVFHTDGSERIAVDLGGQPVDATGWRASVRRAADVLAAEVAPHPHATALVIFPTRDGGAQVGEQTIDPRTPWLDGYHGDIDYADLLARAYGAIRAALRVQFPDRLAQIERARP